MPFGISLPGVPPLFNPIPNLPDVSGIVTIPGISSLLNVPSIPVLQGLPNITSLLNVPSIGAIPSLPGIGNLLNVPSLSSLVRVPSITSLLNMSGVGDLLGGDTIQLDQPNDAPWGIYLEDELILTADSVISVEFKRDWREADYPMEKGAFQSYNKVATPFDVRLRMTRGGSQTDRQVFLDALEVVSASLDFYDVVTPEHVYTNANISHYDYRRNATNGVGLISVDIWLTQIRSTVVVTFVQTAQPSGADPVSVGTVLPQIPVPAIASSVTARISQLNKIIAGH